MGNIVWPLCCSGMIVLIEGLCELLSLLVFFCFFVLILRRMGRNEPQAPTLPRYQIHVVFQFNRTLPFCNSSSCCCYRAREHVDPTCDPERSGAVEIATRRCPRLRVVWNLRELTH